MADYVPFRFTAEEMEQAKDVAVEMGAMRWCDSCGRPIGYRGRGADLRPIPRGLIRLVRRVRLEVVAPCLTRTRTICGQSARTPND